ncbi:hypothetical protein [Acidovorax sp.]|uniref:hypothetical protein n=1 Tax=Acidovorax sp. TaxID=1872122 RepID=UPI002ACE890F|nr:hypothetical protein [Acidovorax sp.]MDZ7863371.1 hypothetical protein [Acidovorax sp.]
MTPQERKEFDDLRQAVVSLISTVDALSRDLKAKEENLSAKQKALDANMAQLNTLTYQASAFSMVLIGLQNAFNSSNPQNRALYAATLAQARRDFHGRLLFTAVPDATVEKFDEALKRLVDPDLHSFLQ